MEILGNNVSDGSQFNGFIDVSTVKCVAEPYCPKNTEGYDETKTNAIGGNQSQDEKSRYCYRWWSRHFQEVKNEKQRVICKGQISAAELISSMLFETKIKPVRSANILSSQVFTSHSLGSFIRSIISILFNAGPY